MTARIINGKAIAEIVKNEVRNEVAELKQRGIIPGLSVILVGENPASKIYVKNKTRSCDETGIKSFQHNLPEITSEEELICLINSLNSDPFVHGILVQLPLPSHINENRIIQKISPDKDVDGLHPENLGLLLSGRPKFVACTPMGIMKLLDHEGVQISGKRTCVIGRSNMVGKPAAILMLARHSTVTICHSRTKNLAGEVGSADLVIAAIGKARFIKGEWIKEKAVVIDVGINRTDEGKIQGDVEFEAAAERASLITPVPGGVGPMTIAMLLKNTVFAAQMQNRI
jgi:methylenetetrahydrofolate dehydrogenase (NADP+)/methenyltetrahydrofolate cyclohydrolase